MKRILKFLPILGLILAGCNPMEDVYDELGYGSGPVVGSAEYTLVDDDYEDLGLEYGSFDTEDQAKELLPAFLTDMYPYWGAGSSVVVNYILYQGSAEGVSDYTGADTYALEGADYPTTAANAFYPAESPDDTVPSVLATQYPSAEEGQIVMVEYDQFLEEPTVGLAPIVEYDFAGSFEDWTVFDLVGDQGWTSESGYVQGNGYNSGAVENLDWLVSPEIDLTDETNVTFQISQAINYAGDLSLLQIYVSTGFTGDVTTTTWDEINLVNSPAGNSNDFILSEDYDFSAYEGETINIALKYESTNSDAARWRVESLVIKTIGIAGATTTLVDYYMFDGSSWVKEDGVYYLTTEDYDSMGTGSGQPGQYNNFSSSVPADSYIPTFLGINYPYAQEEDQMIVIYRYYSSSAGETQTRGNLYTVIDGVWTPYVSTVETSLQFGHDGTTWVPDNTIQYTLSASDYDYVATTYASVSGFEAAAGNLATYGNFNRTGGSTSWSDDMMETVLIDLLANVIDPSAAEAQKYVISYDIYNGSNAVESRAFIKEGGEWIPN